MNHMRAVPTNTGPPHLPHHDKISIHINNNLLVLEKTLGNIYPTCVTLVGQDFFRVMARNYVKKCPSKNYSLDNYGCSFNSFVKSFTPAQTVPYLASIAELEWLIHKTEQGFDADDLNIADLAAINEQVHGNIIFHLPENSNLLKSIYPLDKILQFSQSNHNKKQQLQIRESEYYFFIYRPKLETIIAPVNKTEFMILQCCKDNKTLSQISNFLLTLGLEGNMIDALPTVIQKKFIATFSIKG